MAITRFEDFDFWQQARTLCQKIFEISQNDNFARDYRLKDQINTSSGYVMDNIAEGFERGSNKEFIQFLFIAKASCAETSSQLYRALAFDRSYISQEKFDELYKIAEEIKKKMVSFINYLQKSDKQGFKYN
jgi:four helix bundle protein